MRLSGCRCSPFTSDKLPEREHIQNAVYMHAIINGFELFIEKRDD